MKRKVPIRFLIVNGLLVFTLCGCGPIVQPAGFPKRPDSVQAGSLLGPLEGQVIDSDTHHPLPNALVVCTWGFHRGVGSPTPEAFRQYETKTDADGRYRVPALRNFPQGLSTRLARFSLVVYKKGYVAYRHDRVFDKITPRQGFSQLNSTVELSRWSPELSHAQHLLFLAGGPALQQASQWEAEAAAAELSGVSSGSSFAPTLLGSPAAGEEAQPRSQGFSAHVLLSSDEVRAITGFSGQFRAGRLQGPISEDYDTFHLRAVDKPERYDVALRVWRKTPAQVEAKYEEVLEAVEGSKQTDEVGDRSFFVTQGEILGLGFMDTGSGVVVLVTCGRGQCTEDQHITAVAQKVQQNLHRLPAAQGNSGFSLDDEEEQENPGDSTSGAASPGREEEP